MLDADEAITRGDETFYPAPPSTTSMQVVMPDLARDLGIKGVGRLSPEEAKLFRERAGALPGLRPARADEPDFSTQATSAWTSIAVGANGNYGPWTKRQLALLSGSHYTRWYPEWASLNSALDGRMCGQAVGYEYMYSWGGYGYYERQFNVGCTSGRVSVPWGKVSAYPELRLTTWATAWGFAKFR